MPMVRKARCPMCGSPKATPTTAAYIYCDYCGQLMDFDVKRHLDQAPKPDPEKAARLAKLDKKINGTRGSKDRAKLMELYRQRHTLTLEDAGVTFSPRLADLEYRAQLIEHMAFASVFSDIGTPRLKEAAKKLSKANQGFEMHEKHGRTVIVPESLWPIIDAQREAAEVYRAEMASFPDPVAHPDGDIPPAVAAQIAASIYIVGFMTMVDDQTAQELLRRTGLESGYEQVPDPELHQMFCGHCGSKQQVVAGARRVLCTSCGKGSEVGHTASCHGCGAKVTIGVGKQSAVCGHCKAEVRLAPALT
jgi:hypothetical protein